MLRNLLKVGLVVASFVILTSIFNEIADNASQRKADYIFYTNFNKVLLVEDPKAPGRHGTGVLVKTKKGKLVVMTNRHVCDSLGKDIFLNNEVISSVAQSFYKDEIADLCLIEVPQQINTKGVEVALIQPRANQEVFTVGYPLEHGKNLVSGRVIGPALVRVIVPYVGQTNCKVIQAYQGTTYCGIEENLMGTNALAFPGGSGSPVFNSDNELVGLISSASNGSNFGQMVYLKDIKRVLNKN